jgi:NADH ubiquinone oxidoreductase subunit NDUFA12
MRSAVGVVNLTEGSPWLFFNRFGNRYYENLNAEEEIPGEFMVRSVPSHLHIVPGNLPSGVPCSRPCSPLISGYPLTLPSLGRHRWVDLAQVRCSNSERSWLLHSRVWTISPVTNSCFHQHEYNATQVPPEWHSWISHIRRDPPVEDKAIQRYTPPWKSVSVQSFIAEALALIRR